MSDKDAKFKSKAAQDAFSELCQLAGLEKDRLLSDVMSNKGHSEYERSILRMNVMQAYQAMIARAYETAMDVEVKAMAYAVQMTHIAGMNDV